jgi:ATP-binding cassette, subfamily B, bacterial
MDIHFPKKRKLIDYKRFNEQSLNRNNEIEIIHGMQEIKLNGSENQKRWDWEKTQVKLFRININTLKIEQAQSIGGGFINELKNILLTFWAASEVLKGEMTLGMMMASVQIVGQLNAPVIQLIQFIMSAQDAKISIERLGDIHNKEEEDHLLTEVDLQTISNQDIIIENLSFRYSDFQKEDSLKNISFKIPKGKCTAIVGASGSGKTTLMKMLLKFYKPNEGEILIGTTPLLSIPSSAWRSICGTVMQEGFIFSDSIYNNIALPGEVKDIKKLTQACRMANIYDFIQSLPLKFNTFIGRNGIGLSTGQKQRLVLARAIYRDSSYLFFDEATSALDSNNEKAVTDSILHLGRDKTSVLIAHRLSTVKNADQIIVLDNGRIVEVGTHQQLIDAQMHYFDLFKNQLEANSLEHSQVI